MPDIVIHIGINQQMSRIDPASKDVTNGGSLDLNLLIILCTLKKTGYG